MNNNEDKAFNSIKVISNVDSKSKNSGCMVLNGGLGVKKSIYANVLNVDILNAKEVINIDNLKVKAISIEELNVDKIHNFACPNIEIENCKVNNLLPNNYDSKIGNEKERFNIYSNNIVSKNSSIDELNCIKLSVKDNINISEDYKQKVMINTNREESILNLDADILKIRGNFDKIEISDDGIENNGLLIYNYVYIDLNEYSCNIIYPSKSLIILSGDKFTDLTLSNSKYLNESFIVKNGSYIKIVNNYKICYYINDICLYSNCNLEFIYIDGWICINNSIKNKDVETNSTESNNYTETEDASHCYHDSNDITYNNSNITTGDFSVDSIFFKK
tara:strand:- start:127 stop:1125 length:999 start_codon:yes stop_codon:yes gene_type:complete